MLEIPESVTLSKQLAEAFLGKTITETVACQTPHGFAWYNLEPERYPKLLSGKTLTATRALGGLVELVCEDIHVVFNDGTTPHYLAPESPEPPKHQLLIRFQDGSGFYCTVRMYGGMMLYPHGETDNPYYLGAKEKPSPLSSQFSQDYFLSLAADADDKLSAKAFLATEQRIPGLGNGVLQDILFNAGIHPQRKLGSLSDKMRDTLFTCVKDTLTEMTKKQGRNTEKDLYDKPGGYQTILSNKTKDDPCPQCKGSIVKKAFLGGNVYFCPHCQPL
jgi:formamidopyrimidine-DNA glycosylase